MSVLSSATEQEQQEFLAASLKQADKVLEMVHKMQQAYVSGDTTSLEKLVREEESGPKALMKKLLDDRNVTMTQRVEQYLKGMGEVRDPSWPLASLETQAIAARTYALRSLGGELCADDRCQVYLGAGAEYAAMDKAVSATRGQVVTYGDGLASTVYSANAGGFSATPPEGFGLGSPNY